MKTYTVITLMTLMMVSACSSRRDIASTNGRDPAHYELARHAQMQDGQASSHAR